MQFVNAYESWTLYDTVLIAKNVNEIANNAQWYTSYAQLSQNATVPFFNVRNKSVGVSYCNLDSANKLPFVFHCYSIGVDFEGPTVSTPNAEGGPGAGAWASLFFSGELIKHCGFILKVSQDEKLVNTCNLLPSGQGVSGFGSVLHNTGPGIIEMFQDVGSGVNDRDNRWKFAQPIQMPREVNIEGTLYLSNYARNALVKCAGPNFIQNQFGVSASNYAACASIKVTLYGKREVQQRNELHYT